MRYIDLTLLEFIAITILVWMSSSIDSIDLILKSVVGIAGVTWIIYRVVDNEKRKKREKIEHANKIQEHANKIEEHENRIQEHSNRMIIQELEIKKRKKDLGESNHIKD